MVFLLAGCARLTFDKNVPGEAFVASGSGDLARYMPIIVSERPTHSYNRIGQPEVAEKDGKVRLRINPDVGVVYTDTRSFDTANGQYTNLIYRIHFEKVPFSLLPFNLTAGQNVGLLLVVTFNNQQEPVLISTLHTCGCYLAIVPTNYLPEKAYPERWNIESQAVYGATLPGLLSFSGVADETLVIYLHDGTHRVIHLEIESLAKLASQYAVKPVVLKPVSALDELMLPESGRQVSMFESSGARQGYVRDVSKPFEFLLVSWWALDRYVGIDKRYGTPEQSVPRFYTSIKPWARDASDMRDFPRFLNYWGWRL